MATDLIRYDLLVQDALKGVVRRVLEDTKRDGLPGEHYFYITFRTKTHGVRLSDRMRERYPDEMTIVLQHQFWDLQLTEHAFEVGLSFSGAAERLLIPFDALTGFFDPSVPFSVKFEVQEAASECNADDPGSGPVALPKADRPTAVASLPTQLQLSQPPAPAPARKAGSAEAREESAGKPAEKEPAGTAKVVSIDSFRKKP